MTHFLLKSKLVNFFVQYSKTNVLFMKILFSAPCSIAKQQLIFEPMLQFNTRVTYQNQSARVRYYNKFHGLYSIQLDAGDEIEHVAFEEMTYVNFIF